MRHPVLLYINKHIVDTDEKGRTMHNTFTHWTLLLKYQCRWPSAFSPLADLVRVSLPSTIVEKVRKFG